MKRLFFIALSASLINIVTAVAQNKIVIPDTDEYQVLTGDMHIHTTFSDGNVWPTTRVKEAYSEGVEVICITDHLDERHKKLVKSGMFNGDRNVSYDLAVKNAEEYGVIVIKGAEISRGMPPGHFNTLFISDVEPIAQANDAQKDHQKGMLAGLEEAEKQNAFCVWNHPHWSAQQPVEVKWHLQHEEIFNKGQMHGIEVYNSCDGFSFEAFQWAIDKNLTMICGTDVHGPVFLDYNFNAGELRPVTLIFAKEKSEAGVREALENRRTAVFADGCVYGDEQLLKSLLKSVITVEKVSNKGKRILVVLKNNSSIPLRLKRAEVLNEVTCPMFKMIYPMGEQSFECCALEYNAPITADEFVLSYELENFYTAPGQKLTYQITIRNPKNQ